MRSSGALAILFAFTMAGCGGDYCLPTPRCLEPDTSGLLTNVYLFPPENVVPENIPRGGTRHVGLIHVGETVALYHLLNGDTVETRWEVLNMGADPFEVDTRVAAFSAGPRKAGLLTGVSPGRIGVLTNGHASIVNFCYSPG